MLSKAIKDFRNLFIYVYTYTVYSLQKLFMMFTLQGINIRTF